MEKESKVEDRIAAAFSLKYYANWVGLASSLISFWLEFIGKANILFGNVYYSCSNWVSFDFLQMNS